MKLVSIFILLIYWSVIILAPVIANEDSLYKIENTIFNGEDYEIIFTSHKKNRSLITRYSKNNNLKIHRIGRILKKHNDSCIVKGNKKFKINKNLGYTHQF